MKYLFIVSIVIFSCQIYSQNETTWWPIGSHVFLDFTTSIPSHNYLSNTEIFETDASVSDNNGNLFFYTNGDTIYGGDNSVLPNGVGQSAKSVTQGKLFIKKPGINAVYYLFSISNLTSIFNNKFEYFILDKNVNNGIGDVILKKELGLGPYSEKMTATEHCNNKDYWVVVVKYVNKTENEDDIYYKDEIEFLSYLVTENGVQNTPIHSLISLGKNFPILGQLKFNSKGTILASADPNGIDLFDFNKESGIVSFQKRIYLPLNNGYGIEFSTNDDFLYINEKQYQFSTNTLTSLQTYDSPSQLQQSLDGKIYRYHFYNSEVSCSLIDDNNFFIGGNLDNTLRVTQISDPNLPGVLCQYNTNFISEFHPNYSKLSVGLPNFPSFHFYHPQSEFTYSDACEKDTTSFYLLKPSNTIDSTGWIFEDENEVLFGDTISHYFSQSGTFQVGCITYENGIPDTTFQCVSICGKGETNLPKIIDFCDMKEVVLNGMNTCSLEYLWNTGDTTSAITINSTGDYILKTTNSCGIYFDTVHITNENCIPTFEIPNVFTPNNDKINDVFSINVRNVKSINYYIINRWGNVLYTNSIDLSTYLSNSNNSIDLWDGTDNKQNSCSDGVYFYRIEFESLKNSTSVQNGFFHLIH
jgi:gliding motility-associated-like protein